jgi:hypothetical protein
MQIKRSAPSAAPENPKRSEQAILKETDLRRSIESLQSIICGLLIENEKLRQCMAAEQIPMGDPGSGRTMSQICSPVLDRVCADLPLRTTE